MKQLKKTRTVKSLTIKGERAFLMNASGGILQELSTKALLEKNATLKAKALVVMCSLFIFTLLYLFEEARGQDSFPG